jgi:hypothetical protein
MKLRFDFLYDFCLKLFNSKKNRKGEDNKCKLAFM